MSDAWLLDDYPHILSVMLSSNPVKKEKHWFAIVMAEVSEEIFKRMDQQREHEVCGLEFPLRKKFPLSELEQDLNALGLSSIEELMLEAGVIGLPFPPSIAAKPVHLPETHLDKRWKPKVRTHLDPRRIPLHQIADSSANLMKYLAEIDELKSKKRDPMSYRTDLHIRVYDSAQFVELVGKSGDITINVSGLEVNLSDLASAGWTCRVIHSIYGGRSKVSFYGKDNRSTISFRLPGHHRSKSDYELMQYLTEATFNVLPKVITKEHTDLELLEQVERRITKRLKARPKKKVAPKPEVMQKLMVMGAA